jgi:hypothetical protein
MTERTKLKPRFRQSRGRFRSTAVNGRKSNKKMGKNWLTNRRALALKGATALVGQQGQRLANWTEWQCGVDRHKLQVQRTRYGS